MKLRTWEKLMAIRDIFKFSKKTFFDPASWLDFSGLKAQTVYIKTALKELYKKPTPGKPEAFSSAKKRLHLSDEALSKMSQNYQSWAFIFCLLGACLFFYSFYLLFTFVIHGFLLGVAVSALFLSQAFKYDFWAMQIKRRQLGLSFADWKAYRFGKGHSNV